MAKSKSKSKATGRDPSSTIAKRSLPASQPSPVRLSPSAPVALLPVRPSLAGLEDRRTFHPLGRQRPAQTTSGAPAQIGIVNKARPPARTRAALAQVNRFGKKAPSQTKATITFAAPKETLVCIRRQRRKEVLFAKKKTRGGKAGKRTWLSKISCRR